MMLRKKFNVCTGLILWFTLCYFYYTPFPKDPNEEALELATPTDPVVELLKQSAGKNLNTLGVEI